VGNALSTPPAWTEKAWTEKDMWGPSVIRWQGRYLLFYSASRAPTGRHCVAVATASSPQGPFAARRIIACHSGRQRGFIDPAPLAVGRRLYLFFAVDEPQHLIGVLALNHGGLRSTGRSARVLGVSPRWGPLNDATVEGPSPLKRNGRYYLFYSAGSWDSDYRMAYAVARSPMGPYRDSAPVALIGSLPGLPAPGGGAVLSGPGHANWLAFAAWTGTPGYALGSQRTLRIAPLRWNRRGVPRALLTG
jgi:beta-xylosidase